MRRIGLAVVLAVGLTLPTLAAKAQDTARKAHVGVLLLTPRAGAGGTYIEALRGGLRELGYAEGQNLLLEIRSAEGRPDRLRVRIASLPAVTSTSGRVCSEALQQAPAENITGLSVQQTDAAPKRLELLREVVPRLHRLAIVANADSRSSMLDMADVRDRAGSRLPRRTHTSATDGGGARYFLLRVCVV